MNRKTATSTRTHLAAWFALLVFAATAGLLLFRGAEPAVDSPPAVSNSQGDVQVYFSRPEDPAARTLRGGPDAELAASIGAARYSVDIAAYRLDLWSIRDALLEAARRGVRVRVVLEGENAAAPEVKALLAGGIPVTADSHPALMHDKFVVIDSNQVWTGSLNFTINGAYRNNNNLLRIESTQLAARYTAEFEEMFIEQRFGALSAPDDPSPRMPIQDGWVEVYFSPDSQVERRLDGLLGEAREEIDLMVFNLTSDLLAEALLERMQAGVIVKGVFEQSQAENSGGEYRSLEAAGAEVRLDSNPDDMHHKVIIIDRTIVVTGSYNFSRAARDENDENLLILSSPALAAEYLIEFDRLFASAGS